MTHTMDATQKKVFNNLKIIHPQAAEAYARLLIELSNREEHFSTAVIAHCARETLNLLTRYLDVIKTREDVLCFLHMDTIDFEIKDLLTLDKDKVFAIIQKKSSIQEEEKTYHLSAKGKYILFLLKYYSPKLTYNEAQMRAKEIQDYEFYKYVHTNEPISKEDAQNWIDNLSRFTALFTGVRTPLATDITSEIDLFVQKYANTSKKDTKDLLQKLKQQITMDLFLKNYFYKQLIKSTKPDAFLEELENLDIFKQVPIYAEESSGSYINYTWPEGEYLAAIVNKKTTTKIKKILSEIEGCFLSNTAGKKFNFWFADTYIKILLKLYTYDSDFSIKSLITLFQNLNKISLSIYQKDFLALINQEVKGDRIDNVIKILGTLCKINWTYTPYKYMNYKTYSFHHISILNEYEYEQVLESAKQLLQNNKFDLAKLLLSVLFKDIPKWPKDVQDAFRRQIISRSTIEEHEQTGPATNLVEKVFTLMRDLFLALPVKQIENELCKYQKWPIINRLIIYLIFKNGNVSLAKKYLVNKKNLQSTQCYHEYYWLLKKYFAELSFDDQQKIYTLIQAFSNSFKEDDLKKHVLVNRLAIIEDSLDASHKKLFNKLKEKGMQPRTECPDFLSYSVIHNTTDKVETSRRTPATFNELREILINNPVDINSWRVDYDISKMLKEFILEHHTDIFNDLTLFNGISSVYYYDIFETLSKISDTFITNNFGLVLNYISMLLYRNKSRQLCAAISNFFRSCIAETKLKDILTPNTVTYLQDILLEMIQLPDLATNKHFEEYKNNPTDTLNQAINDPAGVAFECMILICARAKENGIEYNSEKLEQCLNIALENSYLGLICRSLVGLYLGWLHKNHVSWCLRNQNKLFHQENYLFLSVIFGLLNYRDASTALYPYLESHLKRLLYIQIPHSSITRLGYYLLFYYLNDKIPLDNSTHAALSMHEIFSNQLIKNNIFWQIHHIFYIKSEIDEKYVVKTKELLNYYTTNKLYKDGDQLHQYDVLYSDNWFDSKWFIKRYTIWSKYDSFYRKSACFWEKLTTNFNPSLVCNYIGILNNLFQSQDELDFETEDFKKLYNFLLLVVKHSKNKDVCRKLIDMIIKKLFSETQREQLRNLYHSF